LRDGKLIDSALENEKNNVNDGTYLLGNSIAIMGTSFAILLIIFAFTFYILITNVNTFWIVISSILCSYVITIVYYQKKKKSKKLNIF
jgi:hypothetical protein